jgi:transposase InsO family protein
LKKKIRLLCSIAKVSKSGYYRWLEHSDERDKDYRDHLLIKEVFDKGKSKYGFRTIKMKLLKDHQVVMNHKKIIRLKKKYRLFTKIRRIHPYKDIIKKSLEHRTFANQLNREFKQEVPGKVFCTDITFLAFGGHMAYLSAVKDIASREVVGWNLSQRLEMDIIIDTIKDLKNNKDIGSFEGAIIHSDQGFHYTSPAYIKMISDLKMVQSMSRKGNCIDNAPMESFFGHLKDDVGYKDCKTFEELNSLIANYIKDYNAERQQWNLKKMTPAEYRNHLLLEQV